MKVRSRSSLSALLIILSALFTIGASSVRTDVSNSINFQGLLKNAAGSPATNGTYNVTTKTCSGPQTTDDQVVTIVVSGPTVDLCFSSAQAYNSPNWLVGPPIAGDFTGDGHPDIMMGVHLFPNLGNGTFGTSVTVPWVGDSPCAADFDGVHGLDYAGYECTDIESNLGAITDRLNNGTGQFNTAWTCDLTCDYGGTPVPGDYDGDGDQDLVVSGGIGAAVLKNNGSGVFSTFSDVGTSGGPRLAAKIDADNDLDLVGANNFGQIWTRMNNGSGTFAGGSAFTVAAPGVGIDVAAADWEGDGDQDLIYILLQPSQVGVLFNDGTGVFTLGPTYPVTASPIDVAVADLDLDGDPDVAVSSQANSMVTVYRNDLPGLSARTDLTTVGVATYGITLADVDGDSRIDIITSNGVIGSSKIAVLKNCVVPACNCPDQGDVANNDQAVDVFDVIAEIGIAFSGGVDIQDPGCPTTRGDVANNDQAVDVFDVIALIGVAFSGGTLPNPCAP